MTQPLPLEPVPPSTCVLYHGDCLDVMPTLAPQSVQMVFADLPYSHKRGGKVRRCTENAWDIPFDLRHFWLRVAGVAEDRAACALTATQPFASYLIESNVASFRYDLIWQKSRPTGFFNAKKMPMRAHETIAIFSSKASRYNPQMRHGQKARGERIRAKETANWGVTRGATMAANNGIHYPISVIPIATEIRTPNIRHPTQKPVALLDWLIRTYSNRGDTCLDPVAGSGTTGVAAARLGRNCILIEKDKSYFDVMHARIAAERERLGLTPPAIG